MLARSAPQTNCIHRISGSLEGSLPALVQPAAFTGDSPLANDSQNCTFERNSLLGGIAMSVGTRPTAALGCATGADRIGRPKLRPFRFCPAPGFILSLRSNKAVPEM